jgi:hypothetical protein
MSERLLTFSDDEAKHIEREGVLPEQCGESGRIHRVAECADVLDDFGNVREETMAFLVEPFGGEIGKLRKDEIEIDLLESHSRPMIKYSSTSLRSWATPL